MTSNIDAIRDELVNGTGLGGIIAPATARGSARTGRAPSLDVGLGLATGIGAGGALYYLNAMRLQRTLCAYCLAGAAGMFAMAATAVPPALRAVTRWRRR